MENNITIALLLGTVRSKRESVKVARYVADFARRYQNVQVVFVDPKELSFTDEGEEGKDPVYSQITNDADAFIIVSPEYNHSFPGSLKRMLDSEYANYKHKPVSLVGVSSGGWGGTRVCEALLPVCHRLGMINIQPEVYFPKVQELFDESGVLKSQYAEQYDKSLESMYNELLWFVSKLKGVES